MARLTNRRIDNDAHDKMMERNHNGIRCFVFHPDGGWVLITDDGDAFWQGIPRECAETLERFHDEGAQLRWVAFPAEGGNRWSILHDDGFFNRNVPDECHDTMVDLHGRGKTPRRVVFPPEGGKRWLVLHDDGFFARNIDDECYQIMRNRQQGPNRVHHVAFEQDGGWVVLAGDAYFARSIDRECFEELGEFRSDKWLIDQVVFDHDGTGWSVIANDTFANPTADRIRIFEGSVAGNSIWPEMRARNVLGCAVAVVENNQLAWSTGYGWAAKDTSHAVHPETIFQAASISKTFTALGVLRLVDDGEIKLDDDVRDYLDGWTLEIDGVEAPSNEPTFRRLLSHTGGTNVHGYAGYRPNRRMPSVIDILNGKRPARPSEGPVEIVTNPGTTFDYSGGGYTVIEKAIADITGRDTRDWLDAEVVAPLGMTRSTFAVDAAGDESDLASGHRGGRMISGRRWRDPACAAGLYTTVEDLARMIICINQGGMIDGTQLFRADLIDEMLTKQPNSGYGLGVDVLNNTARTDPSFRYAHGGTNRGFRCYYRAWPTKGAGVVTMTNDDGDSAFRTDVVAAAADTHGF